MRKNARSRGSRIPGNAQRNGFGALDVGPRRHENRGRPRGSVKKRIPFRKKARLHVEIASPRPGNGALNPSLDLPLPGKGDGEKLGAQAEPLHVLREKHGRRPLPPEGFEHPLSVEKRPKRRRVSELPPVQKEKFLHREDYSTCPGAVTRPS